MSRKQGIRLLLQGRRVAIVVLAVASMVVFVTPGQAVDLSSGNYTLNLDTTISWGARYRVSDRDMRLISTFEGGTAWSVNGDDGNLNFDTGIVSNTLKATIDLDYAYKNFGIFVRGSGFYDFELEDGDRERTPISKEGLDWAGSRTELLDAFAWFKFRVGNGGGEFRVGNQVLNWGESTFIQGGLSSINPIDVSAIRVPGAELREAFRPNGLVWGSIDLSSALSLEGFYQYEWNETVIDPPGTYFSTNDFAGRGGTTVFLAFSSFADNGAPPPWADQTIDHPFMGVSGGEDNEPDDGGQYGLALRWFAEDLGGTEFGFYFVNYHSRLPIISAVTGSADIVPSLPGIGASAALMVYYMYGVPPGVSPEVDAAAHGAATAAATDAYVDTAHYFLDYVEDIRMYGFSWNAQLGTSGIAFQGELSYQQDKPFQVDDVELLFASLSPISAGLAATNQVAPGGVGFDTVINGYRLLDAYQAQFTLTKVFGPILGSDQGVLLMEMAYDHISGMPSKDVLRFDGPGTYTSGNPLMTEPGGAHAGKPYEPASAFADPNSWGYRLAGKLVYNNAIGAWSLTPRFGWQHDVSGVTPGPGGNFIEGRKALTIGVAASYQNKWQLDLSYTNYSGAGRYNLINDRDFVGAFVKYSF